LDIDKNSQEGSTIFAANLKSSSVFPTASNTSLLVAIWPGLEGHNESMKDWFRPTLTIWINVLTDDTDDNDGEAWEKLTNTLAVPGDEENTVASLLWCKQNGIAAETNGMDRYMYVTFVILVYFLRESSTDAAIALIRISA
jgi:hypothetical protein